MSYQDWTELQIRDAQRRGEFDNLAGAGQPLPDLDRPRDELEWIARYLNRENIDPSAILPPALALAREVELLPETLRRKPTEELVRKAVQELNTRITAARLAPEDGPPVRVKPVDEELAVIRWQQSRSLSEAARAARAAVPPAPHADADQRRMTAATAPDSHRPPGSRRRWRSWLHR
jgi:hypothetical protein